MFSSRSQFDKLFDKATNTISSESDWTTIIKICEMIRQGEIQPKYVLAQIKKKSTHANPHTALFALEVLELCVKNCGCLVHDEISTQAYMEQLTYVVKTTLHEEVKNKILELLQAWAFVFKDIQKYKIIVDTVNDMKKEGYTFPKMKESDAIFSTEIAPEWTTGLNCTQCGAQFGVILRRHHCRACGKVFCGQCSSKTCPLPRFGFEKEVRVCDHCHLKQKYNRAPTSGEMSIEYAIGLLNEIPYNTLNNTLHERLTEEEALQLALAFSQSEAEMKKEDNSTLSKCDKEEVVSQSESGESPSLPHSEDESSQYINQCQSCGQDFYNKFLAKNCSNLSKSKTGKVVKLCDKCKEKHCTPLFSKPKPQVVNLEEVPIELPGLQDERIQVCTPSNIDEETRDKEDLKLEVHQSPPLSLSEPESSNPSIAQSEPEFSNPFLPQSEPASSQDIDDANNDETFGENVEVAEEAKYYYEPETEVSILSSNAASEQQAFTEVNNLSRIEEDTSSESSLTERFQMLKDEHSCTNCNEFTLFGQQVAVQLNKLSIKKALEVQQEIQKILAQARINELSWSSNSSVALDNSLISLFQPSTSALSRDEVDSESSKESIKEQVYVTETLESSA